MKKRIISAVCLLPILVWILVAAPLRDAVFLCCFLSCVAAFELMNLKASVQNKWMRLSTYAAAAAVPVWCYRGMVLLEGEMLLLALCLLLFFIAMRTQEPVPFPCMALCITAGLILPFIFSGILRLMNMPEGRSAVLLPFLLAFLSDTGAYFTGLAFGKHHFAPRISPNKTTEGVIGGFCCSLAGMLLFVFCFNRKAAGMQASYPVAISYGILGAAFATFGDLCFSFIKRRTGVKDFGTLIPGHGGILDRFDSIAATLLLTEVLVQVQPLIISIE